MIAAQVISQKKKELDHVQNVVINNIKKKNQVLL